MNFGGPVFVILIVGICMAAWMFTTWIRARHGYPITDDWGNTVNPVGTKEAEQHIQALTGENAKLKGQIGRLEERLAVLERIATDPAERTAREIESLR